MKINKMFYCFIISILAFAVSAQTGDATAGISKEDHYEMVLAYDKNAKPAIAEGSTVATPPKRRIINGSSKAIIKNVPTLNSDKNDFSPVSYQNGLIYCSSVKKTSKKGSADDANEDINLRYALFDSLGNLTKPAAFGHRANSKTNEGPLCFSANQDTLYLSRNASKGGKVLFNKKGKATLKIYIKTRDSLGNFIGDDMLPFESENYSYCHPTLSTDGNKLYFASNMPGGFGGMDLWMTRRMRDGTWSQPINLGPRVNTSKNEVFPFMSENGTFYFSSDGILGSKGGYDLYHIEIENRTSRAFPMGEPFNTEYDDFGIMFLPKNETKGYFSSNRKGGTGGDDIYVFEF